MRPKGSTTTVFALSLAGGALLAGVLAIPAAAQAKSTSDIYLDKCSVCHGADGAGKTAKGRKVKVKDVHDTVAKLTADQMIEIVTKGKPPDMDAYAGQYSADQIRQLVDYYRGLAKK